MKIAIFHNFLDNIGGAEIVTLVLARELRGEVYTTNIDKEKISKMGFADVLPRIHSIGRIPKNAPWRHQSAFWKFRRLNLGKKYDFYIIAGDWAMSGAVNNKPNLWYVHSPLNELWEFKKYIRENLLSFWKRPLYDIWVYLNRKLTLKYSKHINNFACNSANTKERLKKYYGKDAVVIHPPIYMDDYEWDENKNYWLSVNRIVRHKRIEMQIKAFEKLPNEKLIVVGSYEKGARQFEEYKEEIEKIKPKNVEMVNWLNYAELLDLYSNCKGLITTSMNEDFGMTPLEAFASGKPVIAPNEGGYKETIIGKQNGILIDDISPEKLRGAITKLSKELAENPEKYKDACTERAKKFDTKFFTEKIKNYIN